MLSLRSESRSLSLCNTHTWLSFFRLWLTGRRIKMVSIVFQRKIITLQALHFDVALLEWTGKASWLSSLSVDIGRLNSRCNMKSISVLNDGAHNWLNNSALLRHYWRCGRQCNLIFTWLPFCNDLLLVIFSARLFYINGVSYDSTMCLFNWVFCLLLISHRCGACVCVCECAIWPYRRRWTCVTLCELSLLNENKAEKKIVCTV